MNISILVFGSNDFLATLPDQIFSPTAFSLEVSANVNQAMSRMQMTPPDVLFVQASLDGSMEICSWLKNQIQLAGIYCILLEDRLHQLADINLQNWDWQWEMTANALDQGADAYVLHLPDQNPEELFANHRLMLAQIEVGWRKAQKYRDLLHKNDLLSAIALADPLTELNNRRALEWDLPRQIKKARTQGNPLSLIILDVDYFKKVNDTHGHLVGDRVLQLLSKRLQQNLRFQDTVFRYGGEEFLVILANTPEQEALTVARRLNRLIAEETFSIHKQLAVPITISLGVSSLQVDDDEQGFLLLYRTDQYLLHAKRSGRNRVVDKNYFIRLTAISS